MRFVKEFRLLWSLFPGLILNIVCCEDSSIVAEYDDGTGENTDDDSINDDDDSEPAGNECSMVNLTIPCCDGNGVQVCEENFTWSECDCGGQSDQDDGDAGIDVIDDLIVPDGNKRSDIEFDWKETDVIIPGECKAGVYEGNFRGTYYRREWLVPPASQGVPITGINPTGGPGITFKLTQTGNGEIFLIDGGNFHGVCLGFVRFHAGIEGTLDCSNAKFEGKIVNGEYFYPPGIRNRFEGWLKADYNKAGHSLINGTWGVSEPNIPSGRNHGDGTWHAKWDKP
ncbi:MAG: hypothetical protein GY847_11580 [Proteobacteria bacterium]|nr:hypothetical protein [Pseudomonadota bacterium]